MSLRTEFRKRRNQAIPFMAFSILAVAGLGFQNCSKVGFGQASDSLDSSSVDAGGQTVYVDFNTPKTFNAVFSTSATGLSIAFANGALTQTTPSGGTLTITNAANWALTYTPANGFRGNETAVIILKDNYGHTTGDNVSLVVANALHDIQPAMAVRTSGCISCHASVASNYITDFGAGDPYFFGKSVIAYGGNPLNNAGDSMYSDRMAGDIAWMSASFTSGIYVPKVAIGFDLAAQINSILSQGGVSAALVPAAQALAAKATATNTLYDYIHTAELQKPTTAYSAQSDAVNVVEKTTVYIGAPTAATILARTEIGTARFKYFKNASSSPELAGLTDKTTYLEADSLSCDGDLVINGILFLNHLKLKTDTGCRIYATGSIFVNGAITYQQITPSTTDLTNLQLVSGEWIDMGVGLSHCESASNPGWYSANGSVLNPLEFRLLSYRAPTRSAPDDDSANTLGLKLEGEAKLINGLTDASCEANSAPRAIAYTRLLMNAPRIDSRYTGQYKGVIISEVGLFGLSTFAYSYDPVFNSVTVLPFLQPSDYLIVQ